MPRIISLLLAPPTNQIFLTPDTKAKTGSKSRKFKCNMWEKITGKLQNICKGSEHIKPRTSSSLKCQCAWEIVVKYNRIEKCCYVKKLHAVHSNGCNPTPAQHAAVRARLGQNSLSIPISLAVTLRVLFHARTKPSAIRDMLREHKVVPDSEPIYAYSLINLKKKLFSMGKDLDKWESVNFMEPTKENSAEDMAELSRYAREWVQDHMNEDNGTNVLQLLQQLKVNYPGFQYRYARDSNKCLTAWIFMTAEMQFFAKR